MSKIGIIGVGFVGDAIRQAFIGRCWIEAIDPAKGYNGLYENLIDSDAVFICLPTPQSASGECDTSLLEAALIELESSGYEGVVVSKCTAPPEAYRTLQLGFPNLVHVPEFLTAANAVRDYAYGDFTFIGGSDLACMHMAERIIRLSQPRLKTVIHCTIMEAALAKYAINSFMATKVIFMNELAALATKLDVDYNTVASMVKHDSRVGISHMQVPGPDGQYGFGGACFPKDTAALLAFAREAGVGMTVVSTVVATNKTLRT